MNAKSASSTGLVFLMAMSVSHARMRTVETITIEVGGFNNQTYLPDPNRTPNESHMAGYIKTEAKPCFWVYPMFQAEIGSVTTGTEQAHALILQDFPFISDIAPTTVEAHYGWLLSGSNYTSPYTINKDSLIHVDTAILDETLARALIPESDNTVNFRMQPPVLLPYSGSAVRSLTWDTEPALWSTYLEPATRDYWKEIRHDNGRPLNFGTTAINFDEVLHYALLRQIASEYPGLTSSQHSAILRDFMNKPWRSTDVDDPSAYDICTEAWGVRLMIQLLAIRTMSGDNTEAQIIEDGLKGIDVVPDEAPEPWEDEFDFPEIVLSPSAQVVFQVTVPNPGGSGVVIPDLSGPNPISMTGNFVSMNVAGLTAKHKIRWLDSAGNHFTTKLKFEKPGYWKFVVPPGAAIGPATVMYFIKPDGSTFPPLSPPITFLIGP